MATRTSAGLLLFRRVDGDLEVLLAHMGGPFWAKKDAGAWTLPKGEYVASGAGREGVASGAGREGVASGAGREGADDEAPLAAARREFTEELGVPVPAGQAIELGTVRQSGGKVVTAFALEADLDPAVIVPGTFELEWPPRSGRRQSFPETDRVAWFDLDTAREKVITAQRQFLDRLQAAVGA